MLIWRIENENGGGMYRSGHNDFGTIAAEVGDWASDRHPSPIWDDALGWGDICPYERDLWKFGFASLSQMRQWVYKAKWRRSLDEIGFSLVCYRVPDEYGRRSNFQAIFRHDLGVIVEVRQVSYADQRQAK